ncbi:Transposase DDE domain protein [Mycoplasma mycoides subsp. mycoides]|nr:Transposase DDE domain protein [Mycoplasma mycoides subsp. mycoides]BCU84683.1 hypothetical protein mmcaprivi_10620 [Mycoplasma mycoides]
MNKDNLVSCDDLAGSKKYKFFKPINKGAFYELDIEKIQEDQKYDGYYVYETNRTDLSVKEVINLYSKQWQIESNFKTLKGKLSGTVPNVFINLKPYCWLHLFMFHFISVFKLHHLHSKFKIRTDWKKQNHWA